MGSNRPGDTGDPGPSGGRASSSCRSGATPGEGERAHENGVCLRRPRSESLPILSSRLSSLLWQSLRCGLLGQLCLVLRGELLPNLETDSIYIHLVCGSSIAEYLRCVLPRGCVEDGDF